MLFVLELAAALAVASVSDSRVSGPRVFSAFSYGARGDGRANDTASVQRTIDAAGAAGGGEAWLPANGTFLLGGGLNLLGHAYDGVTLRIDGKITIPTPAWSTQAQCGMANDKVWPHMLMHHLPTRLATRARAPGLREGVCVRAPAMRNHCRCGVGGCGVVSVAQNPGGVKGIFRSLCSILVVINVHQFTFTGTGSVTGFLFDEHKVHVPCLKEAPPRAVCLR